VFVQWGHTSIYGNGRIFNCVLNFIASMIHLVVAPKSRIEGVTHDYRRHGTTTLFAALDTANEAKCSRNAGHITAWTKELARTEALKRSITDDKSSVNFNRM
jgi:hypothetical protein